MKVLEVVLTVLHGHLVVVLTLRDVSHLSLGFVLQKQDGRRHQDTQNHLETHGRTLMWVAAAIFVKTVFKLHNFHCKIKFDFCTESIEGFAVISQLFSTFSVKEYILTNFEMCYKSKVKSRWSMNLVPGVLAHVQAAHPHVRQQHLSAGVSDKRTQVGGHSQLQTGGVTPVLQLVG